MADMLEGLGHPFGCLGALDMACIFCLGHFLHAQGLHFRKDEMLIYILLTIATNTASDVTRSAGPLLSTRNESGTDSSSQENCYTEMSSTRPTSVSLNVPGCQGPEGNCEGQGLEGNCENAFYAPA